MPRGVQDDLNLSGDDLEIWAENFKDVSDDVGAWIEDVEKATNCKKWSELSVEKLMRLNKEVLAKLLFEGHRDTSSYIGVVENARIQVENLKSELIEAQRSVVKLQQKLIEAQSEQLKSMSTVVDTAVEKGIQSYSQAVSKSVSESVPTFTEAKLKRVVQEAVLRKTGHEI